MSVLVLLMPLAIAMGVGALLGFFRALGQGQFDDLETPAYRALLDESERKQDAK